MSDTLPWPVPTNGAASDMTDRLDELLQQQVSDWHQGRLTPVEQILAEHPPLRDHPEILLDLIHNEASLRKEQGEAVELAEYQQRFPKFAEALRIQWGVEELLFAGESFGPDSQPLSQSEGGERSAACEVHRLGRYEVRAVLGQGGIGVAYRAWDPMICFHSPAYDRR